MTRLDPTKRLMRAPDLRPLSSPVTCMAVAGALASAEVGVHGCRPCPVCRESRRDVLDAGMPVEFFEDDTGGSRWLCVVCEAEGGPLAFACGWLFGEVPEPSDPRVDEARAFLKSLRRPKSEASS